MGEELVRRLRVVSFSALQLFWLVVESFGHLESLVGELTDVSSGQWGADLNLNQIRLIRYQRS